jgi:hypothetical protein
MQTEFWVVGGRFRDVSFVALDDGAGELHGPFPSYDAALACWRRRTSETSSRATARFTVVTTASRPVLD